MSNKLNNISQKDVAEWLGVTPSYLSMLFSDQRRLSWSMADSISQIIKVKAEKVIAANGASLKSMCFKRYKTALRKGTL